MDALAEQAGVAKTTVYRRWPSRGHLIVAVWGAANSRSHTADSRTDLVTFATRLAAVLDAPLMRQLVAELAAAVAQDPNLKAKVRELWVDRRQHIADVVESAIRNGRPRPGVKPSVVVDQIAGSL